MVKTSNIYIWVGAILILIIGIAMALFFKKDKTRYDVGEVSTDLSEAYFAGGCFWCVESDFEKIDGVDEAISGYMGGKQENPTYEDHADHRESVQVIYDPKKVDYETLVQYFFRHHDPTDEGGSFYDRGHSYTSAIYPQTDEEEQIAHKVIEQLTLDKVFPKPIVTAVEKGGTFWPAETYHQDYYMNNPIRYKYYRNGSGRDTYIESIWGERDDFELTTMNMHAHEWANFKKPSDDVLKKQLSELSYDVTQHEATEPPRTEGNFDKNYDAGIYVDIVSGEPLFSSKDKFDSGTGWPSFTQPIDEEFIVKKTDYKLILPRTEIRSNYADSHLGHVFSDGPEPTGERWCMNGAAMRFIPLDQMEGEGYGDYIKYVE